MGEFEPLIGVAVLLASFAFTLVCLCLSVIALWYFGIIQSVMATVFPDRFKKEAPLWQGADGEALPYDEARQSWERTFSGKAPHASWSEIN